MHQGSSRPGLSISWLLVLLLAAMLATTLIYAAFFMIIGAMLARATDHPELAISFLWAFRLGFVVMLFRLVNNLARAGAGKRNVSSTA